MKPTMEIMRQKLLDAGLAPLRSQAELHTRILQNRLTELLPKAMRSSGIDFWIVAGSEYNEDPIMKTLFPWDAVTARRVSVLLFWLPPGQEAVRAMTVGTRTPVSDTLYEAPGQPGESVWQTVGRMVEECAPNAIGVNRSSLFSHCDGLSATLERTLLAGLPEGYRDRVTNAEQLGVYWLQRTTALEQEIMAALADITHDVIWDGFFSGHIVPGTTNTDDIEWRMRETIHALGLHHWFGPDVDLQRRGGNPGLLAGAGSSRISGVTVQPGDLLHCDIGFACAYLSLHTDVQQLAYLPLPGETKAPAGLERLLGQGNRFQDIVMDQMKPGRSGNAVFEAAIGQAKAEGITPMLYTHPLGTFGHGAGPEIGRYDRQQPAPGRGEYLLSDGSCYALELNIRGELPEWDGQEVYFYLEEDVVLDGGATRFLSGRQTSIGVVPLG